MTSLAQIALFSRSQLRKFWWNAGNHVTLFLSASALTTLFIYIFRDFVGSQIAAIDPQWSARGLSLIVLLGSMIIGLVIGQWTQAGIFGADSLLPVMVRSGSSSSDLLRYRRQVLSLGMLISLILASILCTLLQMRWLWLASLIALTVTFFRASANQPRPKTVTGHILKISDWRIHQLILRPMPGKVLMLLGVVSSIFAPGAASTHPHLILLQVTLLACGLVSSLGMIQAIAAELPGTWFEKQAGLTHNQWLRSWQHIANALALVLATSGAITLSILSPDVRANEWALPIIAGFMPWLTPALILQIEGRAKNINMMVAVLIALFFGTAMIATPWAAAALPLIRTQAKSYQNGRFYRA